MLLAACGGDAPDAMVKSAKDYLAKREYSAAVIQLRNALQQDSNKPEARYLLGTALNESRDPAGAEKELRKALDLGYPPERTLPALGRALIDQGQAAKLVAEFGDESLSDTEGQAAFKTIVGNAFLALGKSKEAETAFTSALGAKPGFPRARLGLAMLEAVRGDLAAATRSVNAILADTPSFVEAALLKSDLLLAQGQRDAARMVIAKAVEEKPGYLPGRYLLTSLLIDDREFDGATAQIVAIRKLAKGDVRSYYFEALVAERQGNIARAREAIQQVLKLAPDNVPSLVLAAQIEYRDNRIALAQDHLRKVLQTAPGLVYARRMLALSYLRSGNPSAALDVLQPALNREVKDPQLLAVAGEAYLASGDYAKAAQYYEQITASDTKNVEARARLGQVRFASGDTEHAVRDLEAASAMDGEKPRTDLMLILSLVRRKEYDKALAAVGALDKKQPGSPLVYNLKGVIYLGKQDIATARKNFDKALGAQPGYIPALHNLARLDLIDKKPEAARKRFEDILQKEPGNEQALLELADLVKKTGGDTREAESLLKMAVTANPKSVTAREALVNYYAQKRDGKQALQIAEEASAALPDDPRLLEMLGVVQQAAGETTRARDTFGKLVALQPQAVGPLMRLAGSLVGTKDYDKALDTLRRVLTINEGLTEAKRDIVAIYVMTGRTELALKEAKAFELKDPKDMLGYQLEGDMWASQKKWPEAETAYGAAQKRAPGNSAIAIKLHTSETNAGKTKEADAEVDKWLHEYPKDAQMHTYLGERDLKIKDYKSAARHYQAVIAQQPNNAIALNNLAWIAGELGDPKALAYAEKANAMAPNSPHILDTLGTIFMKKGNVSQGVDKLQKAAQLAPNRLEIRLNLAKAQVTAGNKDAARKELQAIIEANGKPIDTPAVSAKEQGREQKAVDVKPSPASQLTCRPACADEAAALLKTL